VRKTILTSIAIMLFLLVISLTSSKLDPSQDIKINTNTETSEKCFETTNAEATQKDQTTKESGEATAQTSEKPNEQNLPEESNQQTTPANENFQTLQTSTQGDNTIPPDGRIYYPTSSEAPYAYTPTNTPKENELPIIPLEPEN